MSVHKVLQIPTIQQRIDLAREASYNSGYTREELAEEELLHLYYSCWGRILVGQYLTPQWHNCDIDRFLEALRLAAISQGFIAELSREETASGMKFIREDTPIRESEHRTSPLSFHEEYIQRDALYEQPPLDPHPNLPPLVKRRRST